MSPRLVFERRAAGFLVLALAALVGLGAMGVALSEVAILGDVGSAAGLAVLGGLAALGVSAGSRGLLMAAFVMLGGWVAGLMGATVQQVLMASGSDFVGALPYTMATLPIVQLGFVVAAWALAGSQLERGLAWGVAALWVAEVVMVAAPSALVAIGGWAFSAARLGAQVVVLYLAWSRYSKIERFDPEVERQLSWRGEAMDPAEWQRALSGARLVRHAEAARVIAMALIFLLGLGGARLGSLGWVVLSIGGGALATLVIAVMEAVGLKRFCAVPLASGARGAAFAAFVLSLLAVGSAATGAVFVGFVFFGDLEPVRAEDLVLADNAARLVTLGAIVPLLWAMRRVARGLGELLLARRCEVAIGLYCLATGLLIGASRVPGGPKTAVVVVLMKIAALGVFVGGFARLVKALDALQPFLEGERHRALSGAFD